MLYHLHRAAKGGNATACTALARYHSGLGGGDEFFPEAVSGAGAHPLAFRRLFVSRLSEGSS